MRNVHESVASTGDYYHYTYDAIGNRLTQETLIGSVPLTTNYLYDAANRLTSLDSVTYTWDNNGNLLNDGNNTYAYDSANQLIAMSGPFGSSAFAYNGLGDRLTQNGVNYTLDLNAGLTQVLSDGTNAYLYGLGRIAEYQGSVSEYYLGDALGSVRQLVNDDGEITLSRTYEPYGNAAQVNGTAQTNYGFTGEFTDSSGLVYLRARYYAPEQGRFITRDTWEGNVNTPASLNRFNYAQGNPVMYTDPSGNCIFAGVDTILCAALGGGVVGGLVGGAIGGAYAKWMYNLAYTGKCGCEGAQLISQYTESQFILKGIGMGAAFGAVFGALSATGAGGVALSALAGTGLSTAGIVTSIQRIQTDPNNECAWWDLGLSIFGLAASGAAFQGALNSGYSTGQWWISNKSSPPRYLGEASNGAPSDLPNHGLNLDLDSINPSASTRNCANCAFATDQSLAGNPTSALRSNFKSVQQIVDEYSPYYGRGALLKMFSQKTNPSAIASQLEQGGSGARGIVAVFPEKGGGAGHMFNVINNAGEILVVDGQFRVITPFARYTAGNPRWIEYYFLLTR